MRDQNGLSTDYQVIGTMMMMAGRLEEALGFFNDSLGLATLAGDDRLMASAESNLGLVFMQREAYGEAEVHFDRSQVARRKVGDKLGIAKNLNHLGKIRELTGQTREAAQLYRESLSLLRELGAPEAGIALTNLRQLRP